jgi:hypothetical protein
MSTSEQKLEQNVFYPQVFSASIEKMTIGKSEYKKHNMQVQHDGNVLELP